jgi:hypothetical protein
MLVAVMGFWWTQWHAAPPAGSAGTTATASKDHDRDDD